MRWFWVDRFEEFVRCRRAVAIKAVTLAEEHLHDHFPGAAIVPNALVLEGLAQTAGILVVDAIDYRRRVVLVPRHRELVRQEALGLQLRERRPDQRSPSLVGSPPDCARGMNLFGPKC
jgi:3-hydroxymyristoyl/3-hydroxydecanoyl-(acyl carrier protein) dehydratase